MRGIALESTYKGYLFRYIYSFFLCCLVLFTIWQLDNNPYIIASLLGMDNTDALSWMLQFQYIMIIMLMVSIIEGILLCIFCAIILVNIYTFFYSARQVTIFLQDGSENVRIYGKKENRILFQKIVSIQVYKHMLYTGSLKITMQSENRHVIKKIHAIENPEEIKTKLLEAFGESNGYCVKI